MSLSGLIYKFYDEDNDNIGIVKISSSTIDADEPENIKKLRDEYVKQASDEGYNWDDFIAFLKDKGLKVEGIGVDYEMYF